MVTGIRGVLTTGRGDATNLGSGATGAWCVVVCGTKAAGGAVASAGRSSVAVVRGVVGAGEDAALPELAQPPRSTVAHSKAARVARRARFAAAITDESVIGYGVELLGSVEQAAF